MPRQEKPIRNADANAVGRGGFGRVRERLGRLACVLAACCSVLGAPPALAQPPAFYAGLKLRPAQYDVTLVKSRMVRMRDGTLLSTDLYLPANADSRWPVVLIRTAYNKIFYRDPPPNYQELIDKGQADLPVGDSALELNMPRLLAERGYVVAVQDIRGRGESEGIWFYLSKQERDDGYDTVGWLAKQSWSTGKVGSLGCSYLGELQSMTAAAHPPALVTAILESGAASPGAGGVFNFGFSRYGAMELAASAGWLYKMGTRFPYGPPPGVDRQAWFASPAAARLQTHPPREDVPPDQLLAALKTLPIRDIMTHIGPQDTEYENWTRNAVVPDSPYWQRQGLISETDTFNIPALHINSWYDTTPNSQLYLFDRYRRTATDPTARDNQYLIMSGSAHCEFEFMTRNAKVGDRPIGDASLPYDAIFVSWFDHWLKGIDNGIATATMPRVTSYDNGAGAWVVDRTWPLANTTAQRFYLAGRDARGLYGNGTLTMQPTNGGSSEYVYDPLAPTPSLGGGICCIATQSGGVDQRPIEMRSDVLVYSTSPLENDVEVVGPVTARLYLSSDRRDTDLVGTLVDVYPDGTAYILQSGITRVRFRDGLKTAHLMTPGQVYPVDVDMEATHNRFLKGHRIRFDVSSASFPRWDRNLNTGGSNYDESAPLVARNRIHSEAGSASYLELQVRAAGNPRKP